MSVWWSAGSAAAVLAAAGVLSARGVNPRTSPRFRAALIDAAVAGGLLGLAAVLLALPSLLAMVSTGSAWWPLRPGSVGVALIPACLYLLLRDALHLDEVTRRSLGKRLVHLRVVRRDGRPLRPLRSALRNSTLLVAPLLLLPWTAPVAAAVLLTEVGLVWRDPRASRIGDRLAGTRVLFRSRHRKTRELVVRRRGAAPAPSDP